MISLNPQTRKRLRRFREIRRGYLSFLFIVGLLAITSVGELLVNSRALVVSYEGTLYFPTYTQFRPGSEFGLDYEYEVNYRDLKQHFREEDRGNWVLMPPVPYNPYENHAPGGVFKPTPPSIEDRHFLGTDSTSRDIMARLFYGTRIALWFSIAFMLAVYALGIVAAPFVKMRDGFGAASFVVQTSNEIMKKDELELGVTGFERAFKPVVLAFAKRLGPLAAAAIG